MKCLRSAVALFLFLGLASVARAQVAVPLTVQDNVASGTIILPGGLGADLSIVFDQPGGLSASALTVTATVLSPVDPVLLSRLPAGVGLATGFPVDITIAPTATSTLSFHGVAEVKLHTANLEPQTPPLALFTAEPGGPFSDITATAGRGSYRVSGSGPHFSEFLIVVDGRAQDAVIRGKFDALGATLASGAVPASLLSALTSKLAVARLAYEAGQLSTALTLVESFEALVVAQSGILLPDVWTAHSPAVNVAGTLRSGADTLEYSLRLAGA
jgi:hypothetical protein